jgi:allantoinase
MRASPRDLYDALQGTFDYLVANEPMGLLVIVMHCQFGGRPLITSALQEILKYLATSPACWIARHEELANWALAGGTHELTYRRRFFDSAVHLTA